MLSISKYCNFGIPKLFRVFPYKLCNFWRVLCSRQDGFQDHDNARELKRLAYLKTNHNWNKILLQYRTYPFWSIPEFVLIKSVSSVNSWVPIVDCVFELPASLLRGSFIGKGTSPKQSFSLIYTMIFLIDVPLELTWLQIKIKLAVHKGKLISAEWGKNYILGWGPAIDCVMFRQEIVSAR